MGTQGTLRCLGNEQLKNGETISFLSGHGNHSLKPEEGEKEQREPFSDMPLLLSSGSRPPCHLHDQVSAQVCVWGCPDTKLLRSRPARYMKSWN